MVVGVDVTQGPAQHVLAVAAPVRTTVALGQQALDRQAHSIVISVAITHFSAQRLDQVYSSVCHGSAFYSQQAPRLIA